MSNTYKKKVNKLYNLLDEYLHYSKANYNIIETFIRIHNKVASKYQSKIMSLFHQKLTNFIKKNGTKHYCSFTIVFQPYSLVYKSGAKINSIDGSDQD